MCPKFNRVHKKPPKLVTQSNGLYKALTMKQFGGMALVFTRNSCKNSHRGSPPYKKFLFVSNKDIIKVQLS